MRSCTLSQNDPLLDICTAASHACPVWPQGRRCVCRRALPPPVSVCRFERGGVSARRCPRRLGRGGVWSRSSLSGPARRRRAVSARLTPFDEHCVAFRCRLARMAFSAYAREAWRSWRLLRYRCLPPPVRPAAQQNAGRRRLLRERVAGVLHGARRRPGKIGRSAAKTALRTKPVAFVEREVPKGRGLPPQRLPRSAIATAAAERPPGRHLRRPDRGSQRVAMRCSLQPIETDDALLVSSQCLLHGAFWSNLVQTLQIVHICNK